METFRGARIAPDTGDRRQTLEQRAAVAAAQVRSEFGTGVGLAAIAGEPSEDKSPRTVPVVFGAAIGEVRHGEPVILPADRGRLRDFAVIGLLNMLRRQLSA
jgi:hypothetical protein